jgi:hypothetical protein
VSRLVTLPALPALGSLVPVVAVGINNLVLPSPGEWIAFKVLGLLAVQVGVRVGGSASNSTTARFCVCVRTIHTAPYDPGHAVVPHRLCEPLSSQLCVFQVVSHLTLQVMS